MKEQITERIIPVEFQLQTSLDSYISVKAQLSWFKSLLAMNIKIW